MKIKNALLFYKTSDYKTLRYRQFVFGDSRVAPGQLKHFQQTHVQHYRTLETVEKILKTNHIKYQKAKRGQIADFKPYDLIITVGGDGTFLQAARNITRQVILGVNSDPRWSVGRFCGADAKTFSKTINAILENTIKPKKLGRLRLKISGKDTGINILNDILICHKNPAAMSHYILRVRSSREVQRSSGIWVATAAGSTGAIHSAGGNILPILSKKFQYQTRELYCGLCGQHRLKHGILKAPDVLQVTSLMDEGCLFIDGAHKVFSFPYGTGATVAASREPLLTFSLPI